MKQKKEIGFQYSGFRVTAFSFREPEEPLAEQESFDFETSVGVAVQEAAIIVRVGVQVQRSEGETKYATIVSESFFHTEGIELDRQTGKAIGVPADFYATVISLAISTTRGALLVKGAGSFLARIPLPIVDPKAYVPSIVEANAASVGE